MDVTNVNIKQWRLDIFRAIKPVFKKYLGQYTHQRMSEDWHFRSLAFVRDEMTYVFGFNLGFFRRKNVNDVQYTHVGMNVLVRTNGLNPELRAKYKDFFEEHLKQWVNLPKGIYTSFRGGVGVELPHMKELYDFDGESEIISFLTDTIELLNKSVYPYIAENPGHIFDSVVRGAPLWNESIVDLAKEKALINQS